MRIFISVLAALFLSGAAVAATNDEDVARYIGIFNGDTATHTDAAESLAWMGISDTRLFDVIERRVLEESKGARADKTGKGRIAHYIRALGYSGQAKYTPTITKYLSDRVYERHAMNALKDLQAYATWNPVISNRATFDPKYSDDVNRVRNMLMSKDVALQKMGAKRVYYATQDDVLLDLLAKDLRDNYATVDREDADTIAWMIKALGNANNSKYLPLIQEIAANAKDRKVAEYAKRALAR